MNRFCCLLSLFLGATCFLPATLKEAKVVNKKNKQPNILIFIVDEMRAPTGYESDELKEWMKKNLRFQEMLASKGFVFHNHYTNTTACAPARATLHTGTYPKVHGVTQTDGIAKTAFDPGMRWLAPFSVPTMGNYLREAGYKTVLKGKWHVSNAGILGKDGTYLTTYDADGNPIPGMYDFYLEKNVLDDFGYDGWIGPEPHGPAPLNSGSSVQPPAIGRDVKYTEQGLDELDLLAKEDKPWLFILSYVNPHDIAVYGLYTRLQDIAKSGWDFPVDHTLPKNLFSPDFDASRNESLVTKPFAQSDYRDLYAAALQPIAHIDRFQRYYYTLQKEVDENMQRIWDKLVASPMYENTIVIFLSDHGELLASHGGMYQKWYQAYQESIHVPLIITSPLLGDERSDIQDLTSHIDILPTVLDFAKADPEALRKKLGEKFSLNVPLAGTSLTPLLKKHGSKSEPIYFYTEDDPTKGIHQITANCQRYHAVTQPSSVEAIITRIGNKLWKITRYYSAYSPHYTTAGECGNNSTTINEMYNITDDPMELNSLFGNLDYAEEQQILLETLNAYKVKYRTEE